MFPVSIVWVTVLAGPQNVLYFVRRLFRTEEVPEVYVLPVTTLPAALFTLYTGTLLETTPAADAADPAA